LLHYSWYSNRYGYQSK